MVRILDPIFVAFSEGRAPFHLLGREISVDSDVSATPRLDSREDSNDAVLILEPSPSIGTEGSRVENLSNIRLPLRVIAVVHLQCPAKISVSIGMIPRTEFPDQTGSIDSLLIRRTSSFRPI